MNTKLSLKERVAALKNQKVAAPSKTAKEAKLRVAASWTIAKTMLPTAPNAVQFKLASSLLSNSTLALTAMLRQTAVNSHYTKLAEKFEQMHKVELNELIEDPSLLDKMKGDVEKELKGAPKNAKKKKTADEALETKEDAKALENEAKDADVDAKGMKDEAEDLEDEAEDLEDEAEDTEVDADALMADDEDEGEEDSKKKAIQDEIDTLKDDVAALEEEINEGDELDFSEIFNDENMGDKANNLADEEGEEGEDGDFFGPSNAKDLEASMDGDKVTAMSDFFSHSAATSSLDSLLKTAKETVYTPGEIGKALQADGVEDSNSDHENDLMFDVMGDLEELPFNEGGYKRDSEPKMESPKSKAAKVAERNAKKRPIRSLGNVKTAAPANDGISMLASLVFPDEM